METIETKTETPKLETPKLAPAVYEQLEKARVALEGQGLSPEEIEKHMATLKEDAEVMANLLPEKELPPAHIYELKIHPHDGQITIRNKDMSVSRVIPLTPNAKKQFGGRLVMYVKARQIPNAKGGLEFRIVKELKNLNWK